jgi:hypothetical protein
MNPYVLRKVVYGDAAPKDQAFLGPARAAGLRTGFTHCR